MAASGTARRRWGLGRVFGRVLGILGILLAVGVAATGARMLVGLATLAETRDHQSFGFTGGRLVVDADGSSLRISPGTPNTVEVDRSVHHDLQVPRLTERLDGNRLLLRAKCPNFVVVRCDGNYQLRVPPSVDLQVINNGGAVQVSGMLGAVDIRSDDSITLDGGRGTVLLRSVDGPIRASGLRATEVRARTGDGRISLQLAVPPRLVSARSDDADVLVVVPSGPQLYHVDASSTDGTTSNGLRTDPASSLRITATSGSGDVTLRTSG
jgi:hypothetical protein